MCSLPKFTDAPEFYVSRNSSPSAGGDGAHGHGASPPQRAFKHLDSQFPPVTVESESLELVPGHVLFERPSQGDSVQVWIPLTRSPVLCLALPPMCCVTPSESLDISGLPFFQR